MKPWKKTWWETEIARIDAEVGTIMNYLLNWSPTIKNAENKKYHVRPNYPMTVVEACREFGITPATFYLHMRKFPQLKRKYDDFRESKIAYFNSSAENNIEKALNGQLASLKEKDIVDYSFRMLERTDKLFNPKQEIETRTISINVGRSNEELLEELKKLTWLSEVQEWIIDEE